MTTNTNHADPFNDAPLIYGYTRAQAIEDGVLIDLSEWASETGFCIPVACTRALWADHIEPPADTVGMGQSVRGRAHDVLWVLYLTIKRSSPEASAASGVSELRFEVLFLNDRLEHQSVPLKAVCGPGDVGEPVLTLMLPHED